MLNWNSLLSHKRLGIDETLHTSEDAARSQFQRDYDRIIFRHHFVGCKTRLKYFHCPECICTQPINA
jgi:dGTPase